MELQRLTANAATIEAFIEAIDAVDELPPFSEHKMLRIGGGEDAVVVSWGDADALVAVSVAAFHAGDSPHWAFEVATSRDARTPGLERAAIAAAAAAVPPGAPSSLWAHRELQLDAAEALGYRERRRVLRLEGPFPPAPEPSGVDLGTLPKASDADVIALHNRAFAGHPEASGMTQQRLDELRGLDWYDPNGVLAALIDGRLAGYCWTKLHPEGDGEVYLLAVDPDAHGLGIGESLAAAGYAWLQARGARRAMLWVDGDNEAAIALYRRIGLSPTRANVELYLAANS